MFEGVQDQFHQFLAAATSTLAPPIRAPPHHNHHHHLPLPPPPPLSFSLLHGCPSPSTSPNSNFPVFDSYPPQTPTHHHHHQIMQQQVHLQWPQQPHSKQMGGVKQQGETTAASTSFLSTSLGLERERSMAPTDFIDSAWSHDEVLALLRIRSAVENWFPEFTWEHVSGKLSEMGFKRSPQKCKEKFEEESRSYFHPSSTTTPTATANTVISVGNDVISCPTKNNNYRLFSELEELYHHGHDPPPPSHHHHHMLQQPTPLIPDQTDVILEDRSPQREEQEHEKGQGDDGQEEQMGSGEGHQDREERKDKIGEEMSLDENDGSDATHDDDDKIDDHDEKEEERVTKSEKKRRNHHHHHQVINSKKKFEIFKSFCEEIVNKMMAQQEDLHSKILQDMIRRDDEKIAREEAWKKVEMERINLEMEARARDLAMVGERQAKIIEFLKNFSSTNTINIVQNNDDNDNNNEVAKSTHQNPSSSATHSSPNHIPASSNEESISQTSNPAPNTNKRQPSFRKPRPNKRPRSDDSNDIGKRWPREEVLALINIRSNVDLNTKTGQDDCGQNIPTNSNNNNNNNNNSNSSNKNSPLWERISQKMIEMGYNRSAKRCKEKWENINKYFRKTKDMNKNRSVDSRTCPYFHQLSHLYNQGRVMTGGGGGGSTSGNGGGAMAVEASDQGEGSGVQVAISTSDLEF